MKERLIRQRLFFATVVVILLILAFALIRPFLTTILIAIAAVVILKPLYNRLFGARWIKGREKVAAGATIVIFVLLIAIPVALVLGIAISQAVGLLSGLDVESADSLLGSLIARVGEWIASIGVEGIQIDPAQIADGMQQLIQQIATWLAGLAITLGQSLPTILTNVLICLVLMAVLLPLYRRPGKQDVMDIVPFPKEITQLFLDKSDLMLTGMFRGNFVIAFVQGAAMGLVFWIAGVPYTTLFTVLSMFLSLVPMVGLALVAWPVAIILLLTDQVWQGILVIVAYLLLVSNIDAALRPVLVPKGAHLNPALVVLSVFGGMQLMGLIGILYGPVIMILLVTSIEVYTKTMLRSDLEAALGQDHVDLAELGLAPEGQASGESPGILLTVRGLMKRFQRGPQEPDSDRSEETQE